MRRIFVPILALLALAVVAASAAFISYNWVQIPFIKFTLQVSQCKWGPPLAGVYIPSRLHLIDRCLRVSGTVDCLKLEPDGDYHVRLRVDPQYEALLEPANHLQTCVGHTGPHLVVEIIPQHPLGSLFRTNDADAGGFMDPAVPAAGEHITVTGPHVIDTNSLHRILYQGQAAENWAEIHPAWAIRVDGQAVPGSGGGFGAEFGESG